MIDDKRLNEIEARCKKATPEPWIRDGNEVLDADAVDLLVSASMCSNQEANCEFISHSRQDVEDLVVTVKNKEWVLRTLKEHNGIQKARIQKLEAVLKRIAESEYHEYESSNAWTILRMIRQNASKALGGRMSWRFEPKDFWEDSELGITISQAKGIAELANAKLDAEREKMPVVYGRAPNGKLDLWTWRSNQPSECDTHRARLCDIEELR